MEKLNLQNEKMVIEPNGNVLNVKQYRDYKIRQARESDKKVIIK